MGVYLTDLTFIEDGNADFLPETSPHGRLVNFDKRRKLSRSIAEIKLYQQDRYPLHDIVEIQNFICSARGLDERVLLKRSLERTSAPSPVHLSARPRSQSPAFVEHAHAVEPREEQPDD